MQGESRHRRLTTYRRIWSKTQWPLCGVGRSLSPPWRRSPKGTFQPFAVAAPHDRAAHPQPAVRLFDSALGTYKTHPCVSPSGDHSDPVPRSRNVKHIGDFCIRNLVLYLPTPVTLQQLRQIGILSSNSCASPKPTHDASPKPIHSSLHNHFNQERHLYHRETFKFNRTATLVQWRQLSA